MELIVPSTPVDDIEPLTSEGQPNKRRRRKSIVWEYFTTETVGDGCTRACCKQCKKSFAYITGSKLAGTSHLKRHIALGICPVSRERNQSNAQTPGFKAGDTRSAANPPNKRHRVTPTLPSIHFDQERCNYDIARMIILHEYPLHLVEHPGFIAFVKTLQPNCNMVSFNTIQEECVSIYLKEKQSLLDLVIGIPGRVSITMDLWTSNHSVGYIFLTGHFVDGGWNLHRRVLNVVTVPSLDANNAYDQAIINCISDWHLEGRLFTLTVDQSFLNECVVRNLRGFLCAKNPFILSGQLLVGNCFAHVISLLAQDALGTMSETVWKIRESVKYVKASAEHEDKFIELKHQLQVPSTKDLLVDDLTSWDTTYHMLVAACELKEVFACLDASDPDYRITLSMKDWKQVDILCTYLKYLFDAVNILTSPLYPTANAFFPEVSKIHIELMHAAMSQDPFVCNLTRPLQERFEKYWKDCCLILALAVVVDPRFKMNLVEFTFSKVFGENAELWLQLVDDGIHELFNDYVAQTLPLPESFVVESNEVIAKSETHEEGQEGSFLSAEDGLSDFDLYISDFSCSQDMKSELDQYLEESLLPREQEFEVLRWWGLNNIKYPTLSRMASDILSVPVSTVAPHLVFDTNVKKMDGYRSSLRPVTLEALICAKDWFQHGLLQSSETSNAIVKM